MANETIYGCVSWTTGQVSFSQDPDCTYNGCVNWATGQVEVTVNNLCCNDTYYACINWTTVQFQLMVPDYCCDRNTDWCTEGVCVCSNMSAQTLQVTFSDVLTLSEGTCCWQNLPSFTSFKRRGQIDINNAYTLTRTSNCVWKYTESHPILYLDYWQYDTACDDPDPGPWGTHTYDNDNTLEIRLRIVGGEAELWVHVLHGGFRWFKYFLDTRSIASDVCLPADYTNELIEHCDFTGGGQPWALAQDGTAEMVWL